MNKMTSLPLFTESRICNSRAKCKRCRAIRQWRAALQVQYSLPNGDIDFDCPHGMGAMLGKEAEKKPPRDTRDLRSGVTPSMPRQAMNVVGNALHGAASIVKTSLGIDRANDGLIESRLNVCRRCPGDHAVWKEGDVHTCGPMLQSMRAEGQSTCGCFLHKKARDLAEGCPFDWWPDMQSKESGDNTTVAG